MFDVADFDTWRRRYEKQAEAKFMEAGQTPEELTARLVWIEAQKQMDLDFATLSPEEFARKWSSMYADWNAPDNGK